MGVGAALRAGAVTSTVALAVALAASPLPWHQAAVAGSAALLSFGLPASWRRPVLALALAAALGRAPPWLYLALGPAIAALALLARRGGEPPLAGARALAGAGGLALAGALVVAAKEGVAMRALPSAAEGLAPAVLLGLAAAGGALFVAVLPGPAAAVFEEDARGLSMVRVEAPPLGARLLRAFSPERALALGLLVVAAGSMGRLARLGRFPPAERLAAAAELDAIGLFYEGVLAEAAADPALLTALVKAAPLRDEAALTLGIEPALAAGWRPARAEGAVVATAGALERAGRGGEALRLLARHPRVGEVDGLRALFERTQGLPVHWGGGQVGPLVPPAFAINQTITSDGALVVEFTLTAPHEGLVIALDGDVWNGPPTVDVAIDPPAGPSSLVEIVAPTRVPLGSLAAGPHRVSVTFINDAAGPGGDRNVRVLEVSD